MIPILLAVPDRPDEPLLVRAADAEGLRVVRRCMDAAELLAAAAAEPAADVVLSPSLPRLTSGLLEQVAQGRVLIGVVSSAEDQARMASLGVVSVPAADAPPERTMSTVARLLLEARAQPGSPRSGTSGDTPRVREDAERAGPAHPLGQLVAVWGPQGAPGRTTVAVGLADVLARRGRRVCLVDADTFAPSVAMALGVVTAGGGLVAACRLADVGALDDRSLSSVLVPVRDGLMLLSGLGESDRWSDLRPGALEQVWSALRSLVDVVVVDAGFCVDEVEETAWARPRNVTERVALAIADHVVAVADASAPGAARLIRDWPAVTALAAASPQVVRNRAGGRGQGGQPTHRAWVQGVRALGVGAPVVDLPAEPGPVARAWRHGRTLSEVAPRSRLCHALERLALDLVSG